MKIRFLRFEDLNLSLVSNDCILSAERMIIFSTEECIPPGTWNACFYTISPVPVIGENMGYVLFFLQVPGRPKAKIPFVFIENIPLTFIINGVYSAIRREYRYRTQNGNRTY